jgi:Zn finger protein HypA/HybF involved in hydrogenase expression
MRGRGKWFWILLGTETSQASFVSDVREPSPTSMNEARECSVEASAEPWRWCPRCSHELENHKCKLRCPRCHYFMSCSDFD